MLFNKKASLIILGTLASMATQNVCANDIQNSDSIAIVESPQHTRRRMTGKSSKSKTSKASRSGSGSKSSKAAQEEELCVTNTLQDVNSCAEGSRNGGGGTGFLTGFSQFETISPGESKSGTISTYGDVPRQTDTDVYFFELTSTGTIRVDLEASARLVVTLLRFTDFAPCAGDSANFDIFNSGNTIVFPSLIADAGPNSSFFSLFNQPPGNYGLVVSASFDQGQFDLICGESEGTYTLTLEEPN